MVQKIEMIKSRISCLHYAKEYVSKSLEGFGDRKPSPLPGSPAKSEIQTWRDSWIDWGAHKCGDVIDLCAEMFFDGDRGAAMAELAEWTGSPNPCPHIDWQARMQAFGNRCAYWNKNLSPEHRTVLKRHGVTEATIERLMIGTITDGPLAGYISIPHFKNGYIAYYSAVDHEDFMSIRRANSDGYAEQIPWGLQAISKAPERTTAILCGDPIQTILAEQTSQAGAGWTVLGAMGECFLSQQMAFLAPVLLEHQRVVILDDGASSFAAKMSAMLVKHSIDFFVADTSGYQHGTDLQETVANATDGVAAVAVKVPQSNLRELERLCKAACKYRTKASIASLFAALANTEKWPEQVLKALKKECENPPSEDEVTKHVVQNHDLIYTASYGFSEYDGIKWSPILEPTVHRYICEAMGLHRTGAKVRGITTLVKADSVTNREFNQKSLMNFPNGTLEIGEDSVKFRGHRPDDLCSTVTSYPYNPAAKCPEWTKFLETITDNNADKMALLQEMAGHVLLKENSRFQTAFFLKGVGSNGKSVLTETLELVFGLENVTHVKFEDLTQDFQRVKLAGSMLNICNEASNKAEHVVNEFKNLVAGGMTHACFKHKDFFDFTPHCKFIMPCNDFPKVFDTSDGFIRRCIIIDFPIQFVMDRAPRRKHEREADSKVPPQLRTPESLSGIFNWVLEGYFRLLKNGKFTLTQENLDAKQELMELTNPLFKFSNWLAEQTLPQEISNKAMYEYYLTFCRDFGYSKPLTQTSFVARLRPIMLANFPEYEPYRTSKERGYRCLSLEL